MELEKQVCSLELARRLKDLGVRQHSLFYWNEVWSMKLGTHHDLFPREVIKEDALPPTAISAFTVAELGEMLPYMVGDKWLTSQKKVPLEGGFIVAYCREQLIDAHWYQSAKTEADARAKMLIYLIDNKLVTA